MKIKRVFWLGIIAMIWSIFINSAFAESIETSEKMKEVQFSDQTPYIDTNGRIMVPIRFISEELQAKVEWNTSTQQVDITFQEEVIYLTVGSNQSVKYTGVDKKVYDMGAKAVLNKGRVFVPLRFLSETMGYNVVWHEKQRVVIVDKRWIINLSSKVSVSPANTKNEKAIQIKYLFPPEGVFFMRESISAAIILQNNSSDKKEVWVKLSYKGPTGEKYELESQKFTALPNGAAEQEISWIIPENIIAGRYQASVEVWDRPIEQSGAVLLDKKESAENFMVYHQIDEFEKFNTKLWEKTNHTLGRTALSSKNVSVQDGKLRIHMPKEVFEGGEFQSKELVGFGSYEIRMKLPTVPSSITGFFLYREPDLYHETDIEIYNEKKGEIFLTTYADGEKKNFYEGKVPFDLTRGYHNYKIEYYPERVAFYIDDIFITAWKKGFTKEKMYMIVNCWYPSWLKGIPAKEQDSYLEIDWIRY